MLLRDYATNYVYGDSEPGPSKPPEDDHYKYVYIKVQTV